VKIRGFRIELGEIESVLCQHPSVREAVVLAREDTPGNKRLVAYFVTGQGRPSVADLREHLKKKMPEYMVPAVFIHLDKIPLTTNGKVDRNALPVPQQDRPDLGSAYVAPSNKTETEICRIWAEVLGLAKISVNDDFFELGGHSLMVLRAVTLINHSLGTDIAPSAMFDNRTVARLAAFIVPGNSGGSSPDAIRRNIQLAPKKIRTGPSPVAEVVRGRGAPTTHAPSSRGVKMRESWVAKWLLAPLYHIDSRWLRSLLQHLILKLEGGDFFTVTLRRIYRERHSIEIGDFSYGCFDVNRMRTNTKVGRYTSIHPTASIQNAEHPKNTISTSALFYNPAFRFADGYELPRVNVEIGNDVFIAHNATILYPTKKIGNGALIAIGSVVVEDVPPYAIVAGYPAKVVRYRFDQATIAELENSRWWEGSLDELEPVKEHFTKPLEGDSVR
jgi:acetyltransferase-like isoleucine patch superfamily enzyme